MLDSKYDIEGKGYVYPKWLLKNSSSSLFGSKETLMKNYRVEHQSWSLEIFERIQTSIKKYQKNYYYTLNGIEYRVQGYEPQCLDYLINIELIDPRDIILRHIDGRPTIKYFDGANNKFRIYHPDIFIKSQNRIIEVKSEWTYSSEIEEINYKKQGCIESGYKINVYVMNDKGDLLFIQ